MIQIPGISGRIFTVTPNERDEKGQESALDDALDRVKEAYKDALGYEENTQAKIHVVVIVEREDSRQQNIGKPR